MSKVSRTISRGKKQKIISIDDFDKFDDYDYDENYDDDIGEENDLIDKSSIVPMCEEEKVLDMERFPYISTVVEKKKERLKTRDTKSSAYDLVQVHELNGKLKKQLLDAQEKTLTFEIEKTELQHKINENEKNIKDLSDKYHSTMKDLGDAMSEMAKFKLEKQHDRNIHKILSLENVVIELGKEIRKQKENIDSLTKEKNDLNLLLQKTSTMQAQNSQLMQEVSAYQAKLSHASIKYDELKALIDTNAPIPANYFAPNWKDVLEQKIKLILKGSKAYHISFVDCYTSKCPSAQLFLKGINEFGFNSFEDFFCNDDNWVIGHHGSKTNATLAICHQGFDLSKRGQNGQQHGTGEYFSVDCNIALQNYSRDNCAVLCIIISPTICNKVKRDNWSSSGNYCHNDDIYVVNNNNSSSYVLPLAIVSRSKSHLPTSTCYGINSSSQRQTSPISIRTCVCALSKCSYYLEWDSGAGYNIYDKRSTIDLLDIYASINAGIRTSSPFDYTIGKFRYSIDFVNMTQTNTDSGTVRNIRFGCTGNKKSIQ
jgi:hypothetical protein